MVAAEIDREHTEIAEYVARYPLLATLSDVGLSTMPSMPTCLVKPALKSRYSLPCYSPFFNHTLSLAEHNTDNDNLS